MQKTVILMAVILSACTAKPPTVLEFLHNEKQLSDTTKECRNNGEGNKLNPTPICANAFEAQHMKFTAREFSHCGNDQACLEKFYTDKLK
jgi:hypothetical protein